MDRLSPHEAADVLGVTVAALSAYRRRGRIQGHWSPHGFRPRYVYEREDVEALKEQMQQHKERRAA